MNRIRHKMHGILAALAVLTLSACATTLTSSVDTADDVQLNGFTSYAWISVAPVFVSNPAAPTVMNPINARRIRTAIDFELARKGYHKVPLAQADLVVAASLGDRVQVRDDYDDLGYGYYGYGGYYGHGYGHRYYPGFGRFGHSGFGGRTSVRTFTEGTLVIDVFENRHMEPIWHGSATKRLSRDYAAPELIDEAVTALFDQFPDRDGTRKVVKDGTG